MVICFYQYSSNSPIFPHNCTEETVFINVVSILWRSSILSWEESEEVLLWHSLHLVREWHSARINWNLTCFTCFSCSQMCQQRTPCKHTKKYKWYKHCSCRSAPFSKTHTTNHGICWLDPQVLAFIWLLTERIVIRLLSDLCLK